MAASQWPSIEAATVHPELNGATYRWDEWVWSLTICGVTMDMHVSRFDFCQSSYHIFISTDSLLVWSTLQQQGVSLELEVVLKAWFREPSHTASHPSPTPLMPPPLRPKPTETTHPTNSPHPLPQYIPTHLETTPNPYQTNLNPPVQLQRQFDLMWIFSLDPWIT